MLFALILHWIFLVMDGRHMLDEMLEWKILSLFHSTIRHFVRINWHHIILGFCAYEDIAYLVMHVRSRHFIFLHLEACVCFVFHRMIVIFSALHFVSYLVFVLLFSLKKSFNMHLVFILVDDIRFTNEAIYALWCSIYVVNVFVLLFCKILPILDEIHANSLQTYFRWSSTTRQSFLSSFSINFHALLWILRTISKTKCG